MKRMMTYRQRLALALNKSARVTLMDADMIQAHEIERIRAKATVHAAKNPAPRALFTLG